MDGGSPIQRVEEKLQLLVKKYRQLGQENADLRHDLQLAAEELEKQKAISARLEDKLTSLRIASKVEGNGGEDHEKELRGKINEYIREIDRCIALLNS